jgi:ABC-2 type transport system ATP-binding protein
MTSPPRAAIAVHGLTKTYGRGRKATRALAGLDLEVERGKIFGLLGPNGAGKTTLVKILLGLVHKSGGRASLLGEPAGTASVRRRIGYLPEAHRLPGYLTGRQMLRLFGMQVGRTCEWVDKAAGPLLERLSMSAAADRKIREYSKGMMQRIGLIQAILFEPEVVFLDEPTDGVDPVGRAAIRALVSELAARGTTIFINSHLLMEVEMICHDIVILKEGAILRQGTLAELTPSTDSAELIVRAEEASTASLLDASARELEFLPLDSADNVRFRLSANDDELNATIDKLRANGIPISEIRRDKKTLEQLFIELVRGEQS